MEGQYSSTAFVPMSSQPQHQQPFAGFSTMHPQHQQPPSGNENSTLPPLQPAGQHYSNLPPLHTGNQYSNSPHTPHTPAVNSAVSHTASNFSTMSTPVTAGSMPPPSTAYMPGAPTYATSQPPSHASPAGNNPSGLPPANRLQDIRPMPSNSNFNSPISPFPAFNPNTAIPGQQSQQQYIPSQESEPTHVVGSQGRRGILPSVPGRPPPPPSVATVSAKSLIPQKDADGKFPCPHCNKTYLHAKHLKRHLLRHTGDRPYMCHLCKDTFSRSDILKRHFQKCSIRRGNPTGANHLAGQRRNTASSANRLSISNNDSPIGLTGMSDVASTPTNYTNGGMQGSVNGSPTVNGDQSSYASSMASMSNRSSRANSLIQPPHAFGDGRLGLGVPTLPSSGANGDHHAASSGGYSGNIPAYAMRPHSASNPVPPSYGYGQTSNAGMYSGIKAEDHAHSNYTASAGPIQGQRGPNGNMDWSNMFSSNGQDGFMTQNQQDQSQVPKADHGMEGQSFNSTESYNDGFLGGIHTNAQAAYGDDGAHPQGMTLVSR